MPKKPIAKKSKKTHKKHIHISKSSKIQPHARPNLNTFIGIFVAVLAVVIIFSVKNFKDSGAANLIAANGPKKPCLTCEPKANTKNEDIPFPDVPADNQYFAAIKYLKDKGAIKGNPDGKFHPNDLLTRADVMAMVIRALNVQPTADDNGDCFKDVKTEWFAPYICYAKNQGWITGVTPTTFNPAGNVKRAEAWKIVLGAFAVKLDGELNPNAKGYSPSDVNAADWFAKYVYTVMNKGWLNQAPLGTSWHFDPAFTVSRGELANMIYKVLTEAVPSI